MAPLVEEEERVRKEIKEQMAGEVWARASKSPITEEKRIPLKLDRRNNKKKSTPSS